MGILTTLCRECLDYRKAFADLNKGLFEKNDGKEGIKDQEEMEGR